MGGLIGQFPFFFFLFFFFFNGFFKFGVFLYKTHRHRVGRRPTAALENSPGVGSFNTAPAPSLVLVLRPSL